MQDRISNDVDDLVDFERGWAEIYVDDETRRNRQDVETYNPTPLFLLKVKIVRA